MSSLVEIWTDGACSGNPGPGGWGVIARYNGVEKSYFGGSRLTTNNKMELFAAIYALERLDGTFRVRLHSDSQYVLKGMKEWLANWKRRNWRTAAGEPVKNRDLWERLERAAKPHKIEWIWVRGHNGDEMNERVDALAREGTASALRDQVA